MNEVQWLMPMVWAPDNATASVASRPLAARRSRMVVVLAKGATRLSIVACSVAKLSPFFLPKGTSYFGPSV